MTWKSGTKFKEKLLLVSNITWGIWWFFTHPLKSPKNFTSMGYFCPRYMRFELKKIQRSYLSWYWTVIQNLNKPWPLWFQKWHKELGELSLDQSKVWKLYIDGLFLSKADTVSIRTFQRNYVSWHWRVLQSLNENWLVAWKMTEGILLILMRAAESLKICTLIGSVCPKHTNI